jgi:hypothetical protein
MRAWSTAVALALAASLFRWVGPRPAIIILDESRRVVSTIPVIDRFTISYIHSINLSPVDEEFQIDDTGEIVLRKVSFNQLSSGMPSDDQDGFSVEGGRFVTRPERHFNEIQLRVSPVPGHTLEINGKIRPLTRWTPIEGLLIFRSAPERPFR